MESTDVADQVVRRQHHEDRIIALHPQTQGGDPDGGRRVATHRFEDGVVFLQCVESFALCRIFTSNDQNLRVRYQRSNTAYGRLEEGLVPGKAQELFGRLLAGKGPQAGSRPSGEDHRANIVEFGHKKVVYDPTRAGEVASGGPGYRSGRNIAAWRVLYESNVRLTWYLRERSIRRIVRD